MEIYKFCFNESNSPKYIQIYNHIKKMAEEEKLKKNEKLPPIRTLSNLLEVNNSTVVKAYELLEKEGYIYKIVGSGSYISPLKKVENEIHDIEEETIRLDLGNPSRELFPVEDFKNALLMAMEEEGPAIFDYDEGLGFPPLRKKLCSCLKEYSKIDTTPDRIQIISGAQQGIDIIGKSILGYGDVVFVEEPTYNGALDSFKSRGIKVIGIPMLNDGIDLGIMKVKLEKIRPKMFYTMPNFQNPTGISYSKYKKEAILKLAKEYDFYILEDDYLSDFSFNSDDTYALRHYDIEDRVIYLKSFSKQLMPGLRIGFLDIPYNVRNRIMMAKYSTDIYTSGLIQRSLYYYLEYFPWKKNLERLEKAYKIRFDKVANFLENNLGSLVTYKKASGGINFFIELPREYSSSDFREFMLKKGVSIMLGNSFYENPVEERTFRISIASVTEEELDLSLRLLKEGLEEFIEDERNKLGIKNISMYY